MNELIKVYLSIKNPKTLDEYKSETKETLDEFIAAMKKIAEEAEKDAQLLADAPHNTPVRKVDETNAARHPNLKWTPEVLNQ